MEPTYFGRAVYAQRPEGIGKQEVPTCFGRAVYAQRPEGIGKQEVPTCFRKPICAHITKGCGANLLWYIHIRTGKQDELLLS